MAKCGVNATCCQSDQAAPACTQAGVPELFVGRSLSQPLSQRVILNLVRLPANHRVTGLGFSFLSLILAPRLVNVGAQATGTTYDDADAYIAASTLFRAASTLVFRPVAQPARQPYHVLDRTRWRWHAECGL